MHNINKLATQRPVNGNTNATHHTTHLVEISGEGRADEDVDLVLGFETGRHLLVDDLLGDRGGGGVGVQGEEFHAGFHGEDCCKARDVSVVIMHNATPEQMHRELLTHRIRIIDMLSRRIFSIRAPSIPFVARHGILEIGVILFGLLILQ